MPKNPEETTTYAPVLQSSEQGRIDLIKIIEEGERTLEKYRECFREAEAYLANPNISAKSRENVLNLVERYTLIVREQEEILNTYKIRLGLEVNPPINPWPLSP